MFTVGHSTRTIESLVEILRAHSVERLIDIRSVPRSRHNPQFNKENLSKSLRNRKIGYRHMAVLGGLRHAQKDSINTGWRNASFRGYADYMQTPEFEKGITTLQRLSAQRPTAIMCAESLPWRCHRFLVADALVVRGTDVYHIMSKTSKRKHELNSMAVVRRGRITYP